MPKIVPIIKEPNKILRKKAEEVPTRNIVSLQIKELISNMKDTLKNTADGVGLAASQVGKSLRIFIVSEEAEEVDRLQTKNKQEISAETPAEKPELKAKSRDSWHYYTFINPVVKKLSRRKLEGPEGCLSVPGKYGNVLRHEKIMIEAYDENGKKFTRGASRFLARVIQHELDHLDGALFIDKAKEVSNTMDR